MNCWDMLGIEPTVDKKIIKRAYAKKLKLYHPEEDPEGFHILRENYEKALNETKYITEVESSNISEIREPVNNSNVNAADTNTITNTINNINNFSEQITEPAPLNLVDEFMNRVHEIYNDFFLRIDINNWAALLDDDSFWSLSIKQSLSINLLEFLMNNYHLPHEIWVLLNKYFFWTEQAQDLYKKFNKNFIDYIIGKINNPENLRYSFFKKEHECNYDEFINLRSNAYYALINNKLEDARNSLNAAMELFSDDADLVRMLGTYYFRIQDYDNSLSAFTHLIEIAPKEIDGYLNRGCIFIRNKKINEAYCDFQNALTINPDNALALKGLAECNYYMNNLIEAKILYEQVTEICVYDLDAGIRIIEINNKLANEFNKKLAKNPSDIDTMYELSKVYFELECFEECYEILNKIKNIKAFDSDMYLLFARNLTEMGKKKEALGCFNKALDIATNEGKNGYEIFYYRALLYYNSNKFNASIKDLEIVIKINKYNAEALFNLGNMYRLKHIYDKALNYINQAINIDSSKWLYFSVRSLIYYSTNKYKESSDDHTIVVCNKHDFAGAWYRKGYCHLQLSEWEDAVTCFNEALDWNVSNYNYNYTHLMIALAYFKLENYKDAMNHINLHYKSNPTDPSGFMLAVDIYKIKGNLSKAKKYYSMAHRLKTNNYIGLKILAYDSLNNNDFKNAIYYFDKIMDIKKGDENSLINLFWCCININDFNTIVNMTNKYYALAKNRKIKFNSYALFYAGIAQYQISNQRILYVVAASLFEKAMELGLNTGELFSYLSMVYYELNDGKNSVLYAEKAAAAEPSNIEYKKRLEGIHHYKKIKKFFFLSINPPSKKLWPHKILKCAVQNNISVFDICLGEKE